MNRRYLVICGLLLFLVAIHVIKIYMNDGKSIYITEENSLEEVNHETNYHEQPSVQPTTCFTNQHSVYAIPQQTAYPSRLTIRPTRQLPTKSAIVELNSYVFSRSQLHEVSNTDENLYIEDIFIGLKSTNKFHSTRVSLLLDTWIPQARDSVHLMTDGNDEKYENIFGELYVNTRCGSKHARKHMICKLQAMYNTYLKEKTRYKWFCSVDDDVYMNIPNLVKLLRNYSHEEDWFIGKSSWLTIYFHKLNMQDGKVIPKKRRKKISFWFPTGGATICLSRSLAERMSSLCEGEKFFQRFKEVRVPDDVLLGYVCNYRLNVTLTQVAEFHFHGEPMSLLDPMEYHKQVSLSWKLYDIKKPTAAPNTLLLCNEIPQYPLSVDPTRALSLHCYLFPNSEQCKNIQETHGPMEIR